MLKKSKATLIHQIDQAVGFCPVDLWCKKGYQATAEDRFSEQV